jgi:prepilin-type N-terminal cleavage/methylation domain-containing protein
MNVAMRRAFGHRGFSLIELVIVIVILGVVAAIAIPRASSAVDQARVRSLQAATITLQKAVDLYVSEHDGFTPAHDPDGKIDTDSNALLKRMLARSDESGNVADDGPLGPYLKDPPANPFASCGMVRVTSDAEPQGCAFRLDPATGRVRPDNNSWTGMSKHLLSH